MFKVVDPESICAGCRRVSTELSGPFNHFWVENGDVVIKRVVSEHAALATACGSFGAVVNCRQKQEAILYWSVWVFLWNWKG